MIGSESVLTAYLGGKIIADLSLHKDQMRWQYRQAWQADGFPVSPHLPFSSDIPTININRYLRNLLPEGNAFEELIQNVHVSRTNTFTLIRALGLDMPGALILSPQEMGLPEQGIFRLLSEDELIERLDNRNTRGLIIWDGKPRLSVAGIQDKINLVVNSQEKIGFGEGALCSSHILKFEKQTQTHLVINEYVTMRLAKGCGLNVANILLKQFGNHMALLVERFDRKLVSNAVVKRRHVIDGCQALNLPPENKYERNFGSGRDVAHIRDGASLPLLFDFANHCQNPALTKQQMLDWVLFNILIFNFDAHGKNISFYVGPQGMSLTPFYDLVNIKLYPDVEQDYAMAIGDEFDGNNIHAYQIASFAESCQLSRSYVARRLKQMIKRLLMVLPREIKRISDEYGRVTFFSDYKKTVTSHCDHLIMQCKDIPTIQL